jgi:hypothetical protein
MKGYPLKSIKLKNALKIFVVLTMLVIAGCAGESVRVEFQLSHPANPEAYEAEFILPQNPFQKDFTAMERKTTTDSIKEPNTRPKGSKQPMDHDMGHMKEDQSESPSKKKPAQMGSGNQHQEHNQ